MPFDFEGPSVVRAVDLYPDLDRFLACVREHGKTAGIDEDEGPLVITRAPGRLDVMGGISDYSGGLVLQLPIDKACFAAAQHNEHSIRITSYRQNHSTRWECPVSELAKIESYSQSRQLFAKETWVGYIAGCLIALKNEGYLKGDFPGMTLLLMSEVPEGKGVSSSACVEVASMKAIVNLLGLDIEDDVLAKLCQIVENRVVGASCGIMDQMTSMMGQQGKLLKLLCQPSTLLGHVQLPQDLVVVGIDSGERHSILGADYASVRVATFMGLKIFRLSDQISKKLPYLTELSPQELQTYEHLLPETISGSEFETQYGESIDEATVVDSDHRYRLRPPVRHPIQEMARVRSFCSLVEKAEEKLGPRLGALLHGSHRSYQNIGLDSPGTNILYQLTLEASERGIHGGKISGGGSGGTVCVLLDKHRQNEAIEYLCQEYKRQKSYDPEVFSGSSNGAHLFGFLSLPQKASSIHKGSIAFNNL